MLPFLAKKQESANSGISIKTRTPDEKPESEDQDDPTAAKEACGQAIITAIQSGSAKAVADAMQDMFEICDSEPHVEGDHVEPHSYQAQNIKAGQE